MSTSATFRALLLEQGAAPDAVTASIRALPLSELPAGEVRIAVAYSSLNYKDALAVTNRGRIIRRFPMVPGIDLAGRVEESSAPGFRPGDPVLVTGWGIGERTWGGYAEQARVAADWIVPLPDGMTLKHAMGIGTAGFTAMLCVMALEERGVAPGGREVVVTGASGGVGSIAVALLARLGYPVVASTGRASTHDYLRALGAKEIIDRGALAGASNRPMESERWGGAVDTVGGETLAGLLRSMAYYGTVAACGLAGGSNLSTTVIPFILRGVALVGVESVLCPTPRRRAAWARLARDLPAALLDRIVQVAPLEQVPGLCEDLLAGRLQGRVVVEVGRDRG
jgi:acrylyl-CoA reductase (NADPH)